MVVSWLRCRYTPAMMPFVSRHSLQLGCAWVMGLGLFQGGVYAAEWTSLAQVESHVSEHTSTVLPNGHVLIAGGMGRLFPTTGVWIFEPDSGAFKLAGRLREARAGHTATLLSDGYVLIAGGHNARKRSLSSMEIISGTELRRSAGVLAMNHPRQEHTATLLGHGGVILAGGGSAVVEGFDPRTQRCAGRGRLLRDRRGHTATLLQQGGILFCGGADATAELFTPETGGSRIISMAAPRNHAVALPLPDGRVLIAGGGDPRLECFDPKRACFTLLPGSTWSGAYSVGAVTGEGRVFILGGEAAQPLARVAEYNLSTQRLVAQPEMQVARRGHTVSVLPGGRLLVHGGAKQARSELFSPNDGYWREPEQGKHQARRNHTATLLPQGQVLLCGGYAGQYVSSFEKSARHKGESAVTGDLLIPRHRHTATLLPDGRVLLAGGFGRERYWNITEIVDPSTCRSTRSGDLRWGRENLAATLLPDGRVLFTGGFDGHRYWPEVEIFDPLGGVSTETTTLLAGREKHTATVLGDGRVLIVGGVDSGQCVRTVEVYDPAKDRSHAVGALHEPRFNHTATVLANGWVLIAGGENERGRLASSELYDPNAGLFLRGPSMHETHSEHTATGLFDRSVLVVGGGTKGVELFLPETQTWRSVASLKRVRSGHTATLLTNGHVWVAGGEDGVRYAESSEEYIPGKDMPGTAQGQGITVLAGPQEIQPGFTYRLTGHGFAGSGWIPGEWPSLVWQGLNGDLGGQGGLRNASETLFPLDALNADRSLRLRVPKNLAPGFWRVRVESGGASSEGWTVQYRGAGSAPVLAGPTPVPARLSQGEAGRKVFWQEDFYGPPGKRVPKWRDQAQGPELGARLMYSSLPSCARLTKAAEVGWGRVQSPWLRLNIDEAPWVVVSVKAISPGLSWDVGVKEKKSGRYWPLNTHIIDATEQAYDLRQWAGWHGEKEFYVQINVFARPGTVKYLDLDRIWIVGVAEPAVGPHATKP